MRPATVEELARWNELVLANPDGGNVLQAKAFGETKSRHGWQAKYFVLDQVAVLVLARRIPLLGELWYVPKGPGVGDLEGLKAFAAAVKELPDKPFMIKIDPEIPVDAIKPAQLKKLGFVPSPRHIQYNVTTAIIDLRPSEEEILASFKQKTRYNVRLAAKKGVVCEAVPTDQAAIDIMYNLTKAMTKRADVYLRSKQYFSDFWTLHSQQGTGQLFLARYEDTVLAGVFVTYLGTKALYKDGGSIREHSEVQAMAGLQWEVMRWLKAHGVTEYDLHGTPPPDHIDDPTHPLAGLARFKTGFQQHITEYIGTYDLPLDQDIYDRWLRFGERAAVTYEFRVKKQLFY
jgi:lipid II:glycine glycyltransferase (peptidoglycan interpeptide bridge formation enzyme)